MLILHNSINVFQVVQIFIAFLLLIQVDVDLRLIVVRRLWKGPSRLLFILFLVVGCLIGFYIALVESTTHQVELLGCHG